MKTIKALAVLAMGAAFGAPAAAADDCATVKKVLEGRLSARGDNSTLLIVDKNQNIPGTIVGRCDGKKRKIVAQSGAAAAPAGDARTTIDAKAAAAARAASEAASLEARAASAASMAAEAKAAAGRAAAQARAAAIEARVAAETRAAAAAKVAADAQALADAAANEARAATEAKAAADAWAVTAAKAATDAAAAASKAAVDAKTAAEVKAMAQARASAAAQKAAAEAKVAASARAAADAIVIDPADAASVMAAAAAPEPRTAVPQAVQVTRTLPDARTATTLQYDGLYRAPVNVNGRLSWKYFRFYPDGTFITVRSVGTPDQVWPWFVREEPNNERGTIRIQGSRLLFFTPSGEPAGYDGSMEAGQVVINTHGRTGQNQHSDTYEFVRGAGEGGAAATAQSR